MDKYIIILLVVILVLLVIGIVLLILNRKQGDSKDYSKDLWEISNDLNSLSKDLDNSIKQSVQEEVIKLTKENRDSNELNNEKLERFQKNISESLEKRFDSLNEKIDNKLTEINKRVDDKLHEGFKESNETFAQVRERLKAIDEAQKNLNDLSNEMISIKNVLEGNQTRGQYGEYQLEMVLNQVFGDTINTYELQYTMKKTKDGSDVRADAVVFMPEPNKMIAIDSKFPYKDYERMFDAETNEEKEECLKEFRRACKGHITTIKDKYIVEGKTAKQAMMFIPNDGIFAFIHHECLDVIDYAREKNVIITSPSTLPAMLLTINMVRIETKRAEKAEEISKIIQKLSKDFEMFDKEWEQFSKALETTTKRREDLDKRVTRLTGKFDSIKLSDTESIESEE